MRKCYLGSRSFSEVTQSVSCFNVQENDALYEIAQFWADDPTGLLHPANDRHPTLAPLNHGLVMKCGPEKGDPHEPNKRYKTLIIAPSHLCWWDLPKNLIFEMVQCILDGVDISGYLAKPWDGYQAINEGHECVKKWTSNIEHIIASAAKTVEECSYMGDIARRPHCARHFFATRRCYWDRPMVETMLQGRWSHSSKNLALFQRYTSYSVLWEEKASVWEHDHPGTRWPGEPPYPENILLPNHGWKLEPLPLCTAFACNRHRAEDRQISTTKGRFRPPFERVLMYSKSEEKSEEKN